MGQVVVLAKIAFTAVAKFAASSFIAAAITNAAIGAVANLALSALTGRPKRPGESADSFDAGYATRPSLATDAPRRAGLGVYASAGVHAWSGFTTEDRFFWRNMVHSTIPASGLVKVLGDGQELTFGGDITTGWFWCTNAYLGENDEPRLLMRVYLGDQTEADSYLVGTIGEYTETMIGKNLVWHGVRMELRDTKAFPRGEPAIVCVFNGPKVFDITQSSEKGGSGSQTEDDPDSWAFTINAMANARAYLKGFSYNGQRLIGPGCDPAAMPDAFWLAETAICGESVALAAGGSELRYGVSAVITADEAPRAVLTSMLEVMSGQYVDEAGQILMRAYTPARRVEARPVTDNDFLPDEGESGDFDASYKNRLNQATGTFVDPAAGYKAQPLPVYDRNDLRQSEDRGEMETAAVSLRYNPSWGQGQRVLKTKVESSRAGRIHRGTGHLILWAYSVGDWVMYQAPGVGLAGVVMEVTKCDLRVGREGGYRVDWEAREVAFVSWVPGEDEQPRRNGTVTPGTVPALGVSNIAVTGGTRSNNGVTVPAITVTWDIPADGALNQTVFARITRVASDGGDPVDPAEVLNASALASAGRLVFDNPVSGGWYRPEFKYVSGARESSWIALGADRQAGTAQIGSGGIEAGAVGDDQISGASPIAYEKQGKAFQTIDGTAAINTSFAATYVEILRIRFADVDRTHLLNFGGSAFRLRETGTGASNGETTISWKLIANNAAGSETNARVIAAGDLAVIEDATDPGNYHPTTDGTTGGTILPGGPLTGWTAIRELGGGVAPVATLDSLIWSWPVADLYLSLWMKTDSGTRTGFIRTDAGGCILAAGGLGFLKNPS